MNSSRSPPGVHAPWAPTEATPPRESGRGGNASPARYASLPSNGVRSTARIGPRHERAIRPDDDDADGARAPVPFGLLDHCVTKRRESRARDGRHGDLGVELAGEVRVRPERVGEAPRRHARRLDRLLRRHAERGDVEEGLEHGLLLDVAAWCSERHEQSTVTKRHRRGGSETRSLAGRYFA